MQSSTLEFYEDLKKWRESDIVTKALAFASMGILQLSVNHEKSIIPLIFMLERLEKLTSANDTGLYFGIGINQYELVRVLKQGVDNLPNKDTLQSWSGNLYGAVKYPRTIHTKSSSFVNPGALFVTFDDALGVALGSGNFTQTLQVNYYETVDFEETLSIVINYKTERNAKNLKVEVEGLIYRVETKQIVAKAIGKYIQTEFVKAISDKNAIITTSGALFADKEKINSKFKQLQPILVQGKHAWDEKISFKFAWPSHQVVGESVFMEKIENLKKNNKTSSIIQIPTLIEEKKEDSILQGRVKWYLLYKTIDSKQQTKAIMVDCFLCALPSSEGVEKLVHGGMFWFFNKKN